MRFIFSLITFLALLPAVAQAEYRTLWERGHWNVSVHVFDNATLACGAFGNTEKGSFALWVDGYDNYEVSFLLRDLRPEYTSRRNLYITIDNIEWTLRNGSESIYGDEVFFRKAIGSGTDRTTRQFIRDLLQGYLMRVPATRGPDILHLSLRGSAAAIRELENCRQMIAPSF